jgi:hypothetical protein
MNKKGAKNVAAEISQVFYSRYHSIHHTPKPLAQDKYAQDKR